MLVNHRLAPQQITSIDQLTSFWRFNLTAVRTGCFPLVITIGRSPTMGFAFAYQIQGQTTNNSICFEKRPQSLVSPLEKRGTERKSLRTCFVKGFQSLNRIRDRARDAMPVTR